MAQSIAHPLPLIKFDVLPDPITVISAGLGSWRIQSKCHYGKPSTAQLAVLIVEDASGWSELEPPYDQHFGTMPEAYAHWIIVHSEITRLLDDLPERVWNRILDDLSACDPDRALRVIQMHHNIVNQLASAPLADRDPSAAKSNDLRIAS